MPRARGITAMLADEPNVLRLRARIGLRVYERISGATDTEATRTVVPEGYRKQMVGDLALKRLGRPEDLTGMCLFLLSEEAGWITGQIFNVDDGQVIRS
ncbi:SDR family oxidoreductase [Streptosporangium sp. NPDC002544]|uniref:SDR family oxidoreductase n=1 Tax=Streptosporangium sp. NPDC002544 TaxID=3154538 RepID=UPI0033312F49